jgi:hypothetical protein
MSYITLQGHWCDIIVLDVLTPDEGKDDDIKGRLYKELEQVFDQFSRYNFKIMLDFNARVWREDIFKTAIGNESLHEVSNNYGVRVVNFATSKNLIIKEHNIPTPQIFINTLGLLMVSHIIR